MAIAYVNNIPQPTDLLSQSQANLLTNTQGTKQFVEVDHIPFASANAGMHQWVELPTAGTPGVVAGKIDLYPKLNNAGNFATGRNEIYVQPAGTTGGQLGGPIPATAVNPGAAGWSYLPSGIIMQWQFVNINGGVVTFPQPFPTAVLSITLTAVPAPGFSNIVMVVGGTITVNGFTGKSVATTGAGQPCNAYMLAIGY